MKDLFNLGSVADRPNAGPYEDTKTSTSLTPLKLTLEQFQNAELNMPVVEHNYQALNEGNIISTRGDHHIMPALGSHR